MDKLDKALAGLPLDDLDALAHEFAHRAVNAEGWYVEVYAALAVKALNAMASK
jgi:hypothetical protein